MRFKRTKLDIYYDILTLTKTPVTKSKISGWCVIKPISIDGYLSTLLKSGLLEKQHYIGSKYIHYITTQKGYEYIKARDILSGILN